MHTGNFTFSDMWLESIKTRYLPSRVVKIGNLFFANVNGIYRCQHFFDFNITKDEFNQLEYYINKGMKIRFSYIDKKLFDKIKTWCDNEKIIITILDMWDAPKLNLSNEFISEYLLNKCGKQTSRNYKKYKKHFFDYKYIDSKSSDVNILWNDTLYIDLHSWKAKEKSDMRSLDREDIQYELFLKQNQKDSLLNLIYYKKTPLAYSLMFKDAKKNEWYAVKWGASNDGRKHYAGLFCLYNSLEKLEQIEGKVNLDFWGRRSSTYDLLKNHEDKRYHILLEKLL